MEHPASAYCVHNKQRHNEYLGIITDKECLEIQQRERERDDVLLFN
jgi:hypothetical protein